MNRFFQMTIQTNDNNNPARFFMMEPRDVDALLKFCDARKIARPVNVAPGRALLSPGCPDVIAMDGALVDFGGMRGFMEWVDSTPAMRNAYAAQ